MAARIGERLLEDGRVTQVGIDQALRCQKTAGGKLGSHLVQLGFVRDDEIASLLSRQYRVPFID